MRIHHNTGHFGVFDQGLENKMVEGIRQMNIINIIKIYSIVPIELIRSW